MCFQYGSKLTVRADTDPNPETFPAGGPAGSKQVTATCGEQLAAAPARAEPGQDTTEVTLLPDSTMLLVTRTRTGRRPAPTAAAAGTNTAELARQPLSRAPRRSRCRKDRPDTTGPFRCSRPAIR